MGASERERIERRQQAFDHPFVGAVAQLRGLTLDPFLVVLEVGLYPAQGVEKVVTLFRENGDLLVEIRSRRQVGRQTFEYVGVLARIARTTKIADTRSCGLRRAPTGAIVAPGLVTHLAIRSEGLALTPDTTPWIFVSIRVGATQRVVVVA
jgi:hypothetical protein